MVPLLLLAGISQAVPPGSVAEEGLEVLLERLGSGDPAERGRAREALRKRGPEAVPAVLGALERGDQGLRDRAGALLKQLSSGRWRERDGAARALVRLGRSARPLLEEAAGRILEILGDDRDPPGAAERARLLRVLGDLRSPAGVRPLAVLLGDRAEKNVHLKRVAIGVLAAVGDAASLRALVEALQSEEVYVRQEAAARLREAAGEDFGIDPMESPGKGIEAIRKAQAWWSGRFGRPWGP